ncbi:MAG: HupE/UreJ family protein [Cyanobacteria bacterium J06639_16]
MNNRKHASMPIWDNIMGKWQIITHGVILALLCLVLARPAMGHGGNVTLAELQEQPGAEYQLTVDLPNALAGSALTPQLPPRCRLSEAAPPDSSATVLQFAFTCDGQPLSRNDVLGLPWPTAGGIVTVYWQAGTSQSQFFAATDDGVIVALDQFETAEASWIPQLRQDAIAGLSHIFIAWPHLLFLIALAFWARANKLVQFVTAFTVGGLLSVAIAVVSSITLSLAIAETAVILATAALALLGTRRDLAATPNWRSKWVVLSLAILGLVHGLVWAGALSQGGASSVQLGIRLLVLILGMDAAQLLVMLAIPGLMTLGHRIPQVSQWRRGIGYGLAGLAIVAIAIPQTYQGQSLSVLPSASSATPTGADTGANVVLNASATAPAITPDSGAATVPESDLQSETDALLDDESTGADATDRTFAIEGFVTIEPLEVRSEILLDVSALLASDLIETPPNTPTLAVDAQESFKQAIAQALADGLVLKIDDTVAPPILDQVNFVIVEETGIANRETPIPEVLDEATLGVVLRYPTTTVPQSVTVEWSIFSPTIQRIATTITDPQGSEEQVLTPQQPSARWQNALVNVAVPSIEAIGVNVTHRTLPVVSLILIIAALWLDKRGFFFKGEYPRFAFAATRVMLPLAIWVYPVGALPLQLPPPFQPQPSPTQAALIVEKLLTNIYQSFAFNTEEAIYDKLAVSVEGEQLTDIYLENRRALEVENRGGARARVDQVDVTEVSSVHSAPGKQLLVQAEWMVGGAVSHFGHTHYRHNLYVASITLTYVDSVWKIKRIDVVDEHRLL